MPQTPPDLSAYDFTDFKRRVWRMTDAEFYDYYDRVYREVGFFDYTLTNLEHFVQWIRGDFLEVGCSSGQTLRAVCAACNRCVGADICDYALEIARRGNGRRRIEYVKCDAEKELPFSDGEFDCVLCGHTLEHLRDPKAAVDELFRVSRGSVVVVIPLQGPEQRWKKTNLHIQFWPTVESFEDFCGRKAWESRVVRDGTCGVMRFRV
ncbi:MAG: class I SAM-dependent methyltransferase [Candidatus Thermoplasmatota archaeon]|jgi:ubiquinone/menaquinone biosynthesis C-methylase UbiE|nr:class I SAM-dependent methyltransferase [Candidatus Thermoplasmatota archaeon]